MKSKTYWLGKPLNQLPCYVGEHSNSLTQFVECDADISVLSKPDVQTAYFYFSRSLEDFFEISLKICFNLKKSMIVIHDGDFLASDLSINIIDRTIDLTIESDKEKFIRSITENNSAKNTVNNDTSDIRIQKIEDFISNNLGKEIREEDVAKLSNLSTAYFSRFFRKHKDISFQDYLTRQRIALAQNMLKQYPSEKISSVAYQTGYSDVAYFNRVFKKQTSLTPTEYRKSFLQTA
ncbi:helix-turn-helix domain-containing protein [Vibrio breoganii]